MMAKNEFAKLLKLINRIKISSFNKASKSAVSRTNWFIRQGYNIQKQWVDKQVKQIKAKAISEPVYKISISPKALPLILFKPKQIGIIKKGVRRRKNRAGGVKVKVKKGKPILIKSAFITEMKYGENVFKRESGARGSIHALYGPQVSQLFSSDQALDRLEKEAVERFGKIFLDRIEYESGKL